MNTGKKIYTNLIEVHSITGTPTGNSKLNSFGDPDYIAPITDLSMCPVGSPPAPTATTTTTMSMRSFVCNLTDAVTCPPSMCVTGNQYMITLYGRGNSIAPGLQLYFDSSLTQPVTNKTWVRWNSSETIYALNSEGVVQSEGLLTCPI